MSTPPPLTALFQKPQIHNPKISSSFSGEKNVGSSKYIIWLERDEKNKVLNFHCIWTSSVIKDDYTSTKTDDDSDRNDQQQLSFFTDYDACVHYEISTDERFLIFLREPILGKEMYHLYTIDLEKAVSVQNSWNDSNWEYIDRTPDPKQTCCIGFVGIVQLWTSHHKPHIVRFASGYGSLFWDLSELDLHTNQVTIIEKHPLSHNPSNTTSTKYDRIIKWYYLWKTRAQICLRTLTNIITTYISVAVSYLLSSILFLSKNGCHHLDSICSLLIVSPALIPIEWHLDPITLQVRGRFEVSVQVPCFTTRNKHVRQSKVQGKLSIFSRVFQKIVFPELHGSWSCTIPSSSNKTWKCLHAVAVSDLNMHLIGSGPGTGNNRMEFFDQICDSESDKKPIDCQNFFRVNVHICTNDSEFTSYVQFELLGSQIVKKITIASTSDSDVTGFLFNPIKCQVDAVTFEHDRLQIHSIQSSNDTNSMDHYKLLHNAFVSLLKENSCLNKSKNDEKTRSSPLNHEFGNEGIVPITFYPISRTCDNRYWLVYAYSDHGCHIFDHCPEAYFIYDNHDNDGKTQQKLESRSPLNLWKVPRSVLSPYQLSRCFAFQFKSRNCQFQNNTNDIYDKILCYLTLPPSFKSNKIPLVVFPHGGPNARDYWRYDPIIQLLCTRGIAVLQVQFHGSTGFGMNFLRKGMYGGMFNTIQEDIVDAVHHILEGTIRIRRRKDSGQVFVIDHHVKKDYQSSELDSKSFDVDDKYDDCDIVTIDETRIGILGGSFGGFCSLFGITMLESTKARFRYCCAVAIVALYKVGADAEDSFRGDILIKSYWKRVYGTEVSKNKALAKQVSPFYHANKVNVPILILHGKNDPRCPVKAANQFSSQIAEKQGSSIRYIEYEGEGHGLRKEPNIMHQWREVETFFQKFLLGEEYIAQMPNIITDGNTSTIVFSTIQSK